MDIEIQCSHLLERDCGSVVFERSEFKEQDLFGSLSTDR